MAGFVPPEAANDVGGFVPPEAHGDDKLDSFIKGSKGVAAGLGDLATGMLKFPAGIALGLGGTLSGERPDIARDAGHQAMEDTVPSFGKDMQDNQAYRAMMYPFEKLSQGIDWAGNKLSDDPGMQGSIKQALDIGSAFLPGGIEKGIRSLGKEAPKPINRFTEPDLRTQDIEVNSKSEPPLPEDVPYLAGAEMGAEPRGGFVPPEVGSAGEPTLGDTSNIDPGGRSEPPMNPEVEPQRTEGYGQGDLFPAQNPFILPEVQLSVDENGIPIRQNTSNLIAQQDYEQTPQGDLFKDRQPTLESQLVPKIAQDSLAKPEEQVIPKTDLSLTPGETIPLRNANPEMIEYIKTTPEEINRERQQMLESGPDQVGYPGKELTEFGQAGEHLQAERVAREKAAFDDALTRAVGEPMQRDLLSQHPFAGKQGGAINWQEIVEGVKRFGQASREVPRNPLYIKGSEGAGTMFKRGLDAALNKPDPQVFRPINRGPGGKQSGAFDPEEIGKGLAKLFNRKVNPTTPTPEAPKPTGPMMDQKRYLTADTRTSEEFLKEELPNVKSWKDIGPIWNNFFPASTIATVSKDHPAIKWVVDKILQHDRVARISKENAKYGAEFSTKRGITAHSKFARRIRSDDGALTLLKSMSAKDASAAFHVWLDKYDGKDIPMTKESLAADGLGPTQAKALLAARTQFDNFVKKYNDQAGKQGFSPIPIRPNYFPHFWKGDYRIIVRDAKKQSIWIEGVDTARQARKVQEGLKSKFPEHNIEVVEAKSKFDLDNTDAFREALSILDKNDPSRKILQNAFEEIMQKRGFRKQTLFREGKPGYLGSKEGKEGVNDGLTAMEMYFDRGYNFLANQNKKADFANIVQGLRKSKYDMSKETPNAYNYLNSFVDNSTGAIENGLPLINDIVEGIGSKTGMGKSAGANLLAGANGTASAFWLTTPRFVFSQLLQPLYNLPKGAELKATGVTEKMAGPTFMKAYYETFFNPSSKTMEGMNWAKENGFIDSKILDLMGAKFDSNVNHVKGAFQAFSRWGLGKIEQEAVRTPSFIFYDLLLRDAIKDDKQRWTTAGQLTDKYMVDYTQADAPLMYGKMGLLGEAVRPLKQFQHAYYGQMLEYIRDMKSEKTAKPLATFLGVQFLMSGMKGLIGIAEVGLAITAINAAFNVMLPSPEELLAKHAGATATFGPLSTITGMDMSGTLGAPQLNQMAGAPGAGFGGSAVAQIGKLAINKARGLDTEADKMSAIQSVTPNLLQGRVEEAFTKPGQGPPVPSNNMIPNLGPRTDGDKLARDLGGRSTKESQELMRLRELKRNDIAREDQKNKYLDVIVDRLVEGKQLEKHVVDGWIERGGDPQSLGDSIVSQIRKRVMTYAERYVGNMESLSTAQKAKRLQDFHLIADQITDPDELAGLLKEIQNAK